MKTEHILIATSGHPKPGGSDKFFSDVVAAAAKDFSIIITRGYYTHGPGCYNLALRCHGLEEDINAFGRQLCMAMMPSKWGSTEDEIPEGFNDYTQDPKVVEL